MTGTNWQKIQGLTKVGAEPSRRAPRSLRRACLRVTNPRARPGTGWRASVSLSLARSAPSRDPDYHNNRLRVLVQGHTQLDFPVDAEEAVWAHPVDVHYSVADRIQGWPKFQIQVFQEDAYGRNELVGYGFVHVPTAPGIHEVQCSCWRPMSPKWDDEVQAFFVGGNPLLKSEDLIATNIDRYKLRTRSSGRVSFKLQVMLKGFSKYGFQFAKVEAGGGGM